MQIVIDISKELFKGIQDNILFGNEKEDAIWELNGAIINGTALPKHGRLIDADAFEKDNSELWECDFIHPKYCDTLADLVSNAPTILEAWGNEE